MTKLAKWHVEEMLENFVLGGFPVKDDDRFLACSSILTSMIDTVEVDEPNKAFIFHTMSGSEYLCPFQDIRWTDRFAEFSKDNLERLKVSRAFVDEAIKLAHEKESSFVTWLEKEIFNGDLFIEIGAGGILNVYFKYFYTTYTYKCKLFSHNNIALPDFSFWVIINELFCLAHCRASGLKYAMVKCVSGDQWHKQK